MTRCGRAGSSAKGAQNTFYNNSSRRGQTSSNSPQFWSLGTTLLIFMMVLAVLELLRTPTLLLLVCKHSWTNQLIPRTPPWRWLSLPPRASSVCCHLGRTLPKTSPHCYELPRSALQQEPNHALPLLRGMDLGTGMQGKGGGWSWLRMLNKQFFLTTNPGTCSHHVMARDDLLATKHDQVISGAVSVYLNSNGGSLSICLLLKSKRSIGLCIFNLMNSLFLSFSSPFLSQARAFPKSQVTVSGFFHSQWGFFFPSLSRQMSENATLTHLF